MDSSKEECVPTTTNDPPEPSSPKSDILLKFISDMLMEEEEELGNNPYMLHDALALQATEKSLHDALHNINLDTTSNSDDLELIVSGSVKKNHRSREDIDTPEQPHRPHKQLANNSDDESDQLLEMYDHVLLCSHSDLSNQTCRDETAKKKKKKKKSKSNKNDQTIDLRRLLTQCAQALANVDNKTANDLLREIRLYSSPRGDGMERLAHYFANALEARLACTGTYLYSALTSKRVSAAEILKAYKLYVIACPYRHMSNMLANQTIIKLFSSRATTTSTLHIIDFGILYGLQWPCLIRVLSQRRGRTPKLRITGIDFPQPGFRPAERVVDTGRRLAKCAEKFGVPFEYNAIAHKWDDITLGDFKIEKNDEFVVVNCMYRLHNVLDETETGEDSPRDVVLNLIRKIEPDLFIHGIANGTYNMPFFVSRFREVLYHFCSMFDMFDTTIRHEDDEDRLLFEEQIFGKEAMNIIACEGMERVERPETYKQWQARSVRAGFRQVSIDREIVKNLNEVKMYYHKNFLVDEDGKWVVIGRKGRVIQGFSCWRPTHDPSSS